MAVKEEKTIHLDYPAHMVFVACVEAVKAAGFKIAGMENKSAPFVTASTGISFLWGEDISMSIAEIDSDHCDVVITSETKPKTTLQDWGKNEKNILKLHNQLDAALSRADASSGAPNY